MERASANPTPSPPTGRLSTSLPCTNMPKIEWRRSGAMPLPVSRTEIGDLALAVPFDRGDRDKNGSARIRVARCIVQNVGERLDEPDFVGFDLQRFGRHLHMERMVRRVDGGARRFQSALQNCCHGNRLLVDRQSAPRDPADIQQVVHDAGELAALALDDIPPLLLSRGRPTGGAFAIPPRCGSVRADCEARARGSRRSH